MTTAKYSRKEIVHKRSTKPHPHSKPHLSIQSKSPPMNANFKWEKKHLRFLSSYFLEHKNEYINDRSTSILRFINECNKRGWKGLEPSKIRCKINALILKCKNVFHNRVFSARITLTFFPKAKQSKRSPVARTLKKDCFVSRVGSCFPFARQSSTHHLYT